MYVQFSLTYVQNIYPESYSELLKIQRWDIMSVILAVDISRTNCIDRHRS